MDSITQGQAEALCAEWQEFLRLTNWTVKISVIENSVCAGECRIISWKYREAAISICNPNTLQSELLCADPEVSIVHELQHLYAKGFEDLIKEGTWEHDAMETMVEMNAQALVRLKRLAVHHQIVKEAVQRELLACLPKSKKESYVEDNYKQCIVVGKRTKAA